VAYDDDDGLPRGDEPQPYPPQVCVGQNVPHAHLTDALWYRYLSTKPNQDKGECFLLCSRCVAYERKRGYILERYDGVLSQKITNVSFYPNKDG
jgi:hypothetical protein